MDLVVAKNGIFLEKLIKATPIKMYSLFLVHFNRLLQLIIV